MLPHLVTWNDVGRRYFEVTTYVTWTRIDVNFRKISASNLRERAIRRKPPRNVQYIMKFESGACTAQAAILDSPWENHWELVEVEREKCFDQSALLAKALFWILADDMRPRDHSYHFRPSVTLTKVNLGICGFVCSLWKVNCLVWIAYLLQGQGCLLSREIHALGNILPVLVTIWPSLPVVPIIVCRVN